MQTPFGFSWDDLDEDALAQFFAGAPKDEGLTWEAKGDDDRGAFSRDGFREAVAGLANGTLVGYVVVGAEWQRPEGPWRLVGLHRPPTDELSAWLDQLIDSVRPRPHIVIKRLQGSLGPAAVVQVQPLAVPPAITGGRLMARTSGRTVPLVEPTDVRRLLERGEAALHRARNDAVHAANVSRTLPFETPFSPSLSIGLAPTGRNDDFAHDVFRQSFVEWLRDSFIEWELRGVRGALRWEMGTDRVAFWIEAEAGSQAGALSSGAVFVTYWAGAARDDGLDLAISRMLDHMWTFAGSIATKLGGFGPTFALFQANYPTGHVALLERQTSGPSPSTDEIQEGIRYLSRLRGDPDVFEPEKG